MKKHQNNIKKIFFIGACFLLICLLVLLATTTSTMANDSGNPSHAAVETNIQPTLEEPKFPTDDNKNANTGNANNQQGTPNDPYLIKTPTDLELIRNNLSASFRLENDIDMSSIENFVPFGIFQGELDGNGKVIKNLTMECNWARTGFIALNAGKIQKLGFENVNITSINTGTMAAIGGITAENQGSIENCYINGTVTNASSSIMPFFGGAVGYNNGGDITYSYTTAKLEGILPGIGQNYTGVMVGYLYSGYVTKSYYINTQGTGKGRNSGAVGQWIFEDLPLNEAEFKSGIAFTGWDTEIWDFQEGQYPSFRQPVKPIPLEIVVSLILFFIVLVAFLFGILRRD